jgi:hypothetical protein
MHFKFVFSVIYIHVFILTSSSVWCCFRFCLQLLVYCFLFYCIASLHVNVWCIENNSSEGFPEGEDFEDSEQFSDLVKGKYLMYFCLPNTTCILITLFIYLFIILHELDWVLLKVRIVFYPYTLINLGFIFMFGISC